MHGGLEWTPIEPGSHGPAPSSGQSMACNCPARHSSKKKLAHRTEAVLDHKQYLNETYLIDFHLDDRQYSDLIISKLISLY